MGPVLPFLPFIIPLITSIPSFMQAFKGGGGAQARQLGPYTPSQTKAPGVVSPQDPAAAIRRTAPERQVAGLAQVSPGMEAQMSGLTPEEWELIVQQGGG